MLANLLKRYPIGLQAARLSTVAPEPLPPVAKFRKLSDGTPQDFKNTQAHFARVGSPPQVANRLVSMIEGLKGANLGNMVDLYEHSVQSATRALKDGADEETVVCALMHDVGELMVPACHGEVAGALLRPYISPQNYWILMHHEVFQAFYYGEAMGIDKNIRDRFKDHPFYGPCEEFCGRWDETAFDPGYESLPLSEFRPMVERVVARTPYSMTGQTNDPLSAAKAALGCYDFQQWFGGK